jgi:hypothetical protein
MRPNGQHGFGPLFLRAFFDCMPVGDDGILFEDVEVRREYPTNGGNRMDFLVTSRRWILVIENKIHAGLGNDLASYEEEAERQRHGRNIHLAILSPYGVRSPGWPPVTYRNYCQALKREFSKTFFDSPLSKWQVFAREFIVHLESEIYNTPMAMTPEQIDFVENHLSELDEAKALWDGYILFLRRELQERLQSVIPARTWEFQAHDWAIARYETAGRLRFRFIFKTPSHTRNQRFEIGVWVSGLTESERAAAQEILADMKPPSEEEGGYWWFKYVDNRKDAVDRLCTLAKQVFDLWDKPTSGTLTDRAVIDVAEQEQPPMISA